MEQGAGLRLMLAAVFLTVATGCGFAPMYGDYSAKNVAGPQLQSVRIAQVSATERQHVNSVRIGERLNQLFTNKLIDRMYTKGYPKNPAHDLTVTMDAQEREIGIQEDAVATRAELSIIAQVTLRDHKTQEELYYTTVRTRVAYNILNAQYGTLIAKENAYDRALDELAGDVVTRVALYLNREDPKSKDN